MIDEILKVALDAAEAKTEKDGWTVLPEGRTLTLHAAHEGVGLNVTRVEALLVTGALVRARTSKGDTFLVPAKAVFAVALEGGTKSGGARRAGFLG
ncbi:hypothetical protein [Chondromyces crocatus]|uniref:Uncharacterized protein n=1 Tax=Chondromyces crocatus TaxID=52 RepID=A0A0K1EJC5_CHOCO|nr:hypothetical protein [Chondromyces crocatus]AKT40683.1 uncharacterized protein CMC5_048390 [Chondromyces crocatus]